MGSESPCVRCVNLDWLEVYALEDLRLYPMNADYFRQQGYWVESREYGTRVWSEMFTIKDERGNSWIEVRRAPMSGNSEFKGLVPESCHLRLANRACYTDKPVITLAEFMIRHGYIYKKIYRIDICYDFRKFDSGDDPARFARRYIEGKFAKVNQCKLAAYGNDGWASFDWESLSWGSPTSMVSTKMYNKTKELSSPKHDKPYIRKAWFDCGLIDSPLNPPDVWRVEFSIKSTGSTWVEIEDISGKKVKKRKIPHGLPLFDSRDKLWRRFSELAFHYFHFKYVEYKQSSKAIVSFALEKCSPKIERQLKRKDLCKDKELFKLNLNNHYLQIDSPAPASKPNRNESILLRQLERYRSTTVDPAQYRAASIIIDALNEMELKRVTPHGLHVEIDAIRMAIAQRTNWSFDKVISEADKIAELIRQKVIW